MSPLPPVLWLGPGLLPGEVGAKAARLGDALGAGLPVPPGFVIPVSCHEPLLLALGEAASQGFHGAMPRFPWLTEALLALGPPPWVLRTSSPDEDSAGRTLAGLYRSELSLTSPEAVLAAAARCYAHLRSPPVPELRCALTGSSEAPRVALLVQPQVIPRLAGVLFTRDPLDGPNSGTLVVEWAEGSTIAVTAGVGTSHTRRWRRGDPPGADPVLASAAAPLDLLAQSAETLLPGGADLEWALVSDGTLALLQLRPISAWTPGKPASSTPVAAGSVIPALSRFKWDGEHNPAPLSPLHASLVMHLDASLPLPFRMTVVDGALYTRPREAEDPHAARLASPDATSVAPEYLGQWWTQLARPSLTAALVPLETEREGGASLRDLLPAFERFYEIYAGQVGAVLAQVRSLLEPALETETDRDLITGTLGGVATPLTRWLRRLAALVTAETDLRPWLRLGEPPPETIPGSAAFETELQAALAEVGALALEWDLASPTLGEVPGLLRQAAARLPDSQPRPSDADDAVEDAAGNAALDGTPLRELLRIEEEDDLFFARALFALRRAALWEGRCLVARGQLAAPSEVFQLTLDGLEEARGRPNWRPKFPQVTMPPAPAEGLAGSPSPPVPGSPSGKGGPDRVPKILRGVGCGGGIVVGQVLRMDSPGPPAQALGALADTDSQPRILVIATLVPAAAALLLSAGVAGVVTDHGGLLSHGAILARELGIPAVLGTGLATSVLQVGHHVRMDADLGVVEILGPLLTQDQWDPG